MADADALRAAIKNLVVNALKHGRQSPVRVTARADRSGQVVIEVEDHGPGIPDDELPRVFEPFFRGRRAHDTQVEGSGIGLNVVYQVVRSHGGRIRVSRAEPHGTRFTVQVPGLPLRRAAGAGAGGMSAAAAPGPAAARAAAILLVDDEPGLRKMLTDRLRAEGYRIDTADNGVDAATMARTGDYDVIVLDLTLPRQRRPRGVPRAAPRGRRHAGADADGARRDRRQGPRPQDRRRRLHDQAVRVQRAAGPRRSAAAPPRGAAGRAGRVPRSATWSCGRRRRRCCAPGGRCACRRRS